MDMSHALTEAARKEKRGNVTLHGTCGAEHAAKRDNSILIMDANGCDTNEIALELELHPDTVRKVLRGVGR